MNAPLERSDSKCECSFDIASRLIEGSLQNTLLLPSFYLPPTSFTQVDAQRYMLYDQLTREYRYRNPGVCICVGIKMSFSVFRVFV